MTAGNHTHWRRTGATRGRGAFTLVELLTVVTLIVLLIALLLPALKGARDQAKTVACRSQLGQIGVAVQTWVGSHDGNFLGLGDAGWRSDGNGGVGTYGSASLAWWAQLGRYGYIGKIVNLRRPNISVCWSGMDDDYRFPLVHCPGEWDLNTMVYQNTSTPEPCYSGVPYDNWTHNGAGSSYNLNMNMIAITYCNCSHVGNGAWCSRTYCPAPPFGEDLCCAVGYNRLLVPGTTPANALVIMDGSRVNYFNWTMSMFPGRDVGYNVDWGAPTFDPTNLLSIVNDPVKMYAFRHPGQTANGLFHDGHVDRFRPMELTPVSERISTALWWPN